MRTEYIIYHPTEGVYLGSCFGLGFWSNIDPVGQDSAVTFKTESNARELVDNWAALPDFPKRLIGDMKIIAVFNSQPGFATVAECVAAGLPAWNPT